MADAPNYVEKSDMDLAPMSCDFDPNGILHGKRGQICTQVIDDSTAEIWINTGAEGGTTWV